MNSNFTIDKEAELQARIDELEQGFKEHSSERYRLAKLNTEYFNKITKLEKDAELRELHVQYLAQKTDKLGKVYEAAKDFKEHPRAKYINLLLKALAELGDSNG